MLSEAGQHTLQKEEASWLLPAHAHGRALDAGQRHPEEAASLRAVAPRLLGVVQDRVWAARFARLVAPLYQSTQA